LQISYFSSPYVSFHRAAGGYRWCLRRMGHVVDDSHARGDVIILHGEPQSFPAVFAAYPPAPGRPIVGCLAWEHEAISDLQRQGLALLDEVWVPSQFCLDRLAPHQGSVHVVPLVVAPPVTDDDALAWMRSEIDHRPGAFYFYGITRPDDPRKNLDATLAAFARLETDRSVRLLVKRPPGFDVPGSAPPGVTMLGGAWPNMRLNALHHTGHVFVNSHRAEGWGLGITEAMALGRIAIATAYSGNMDYMTAENSFPLPWHPVPVDPEVLAALELDPGNGAPPTWAEIDGDALAGAMQTCLDRWDDLAPMREKAAADMARFQPAEIAAILARRLDALVPGVG